jgi:hypothetical protein
MLVYKANDERITAFSFHWNYLARQFPTLEILVNYSDSCSSGSFHCCYLPLLVALANWRMLSFLPADSHATVDAIVVLAGVLNNWLKKYG